MKTTLTLLTLLALAGASLPASATTYNANVRSISAATGAVTVLARHGADDPAGHDVGDDKGGKGRGRHDDGANHG